MARPAGRNNIRSLFPRLSDPARPTLPSGFRLTFVYLCRAVSPLLQTPLWAGWYGQDPRLGPSGTTPPAFEIRAIVSE